MEQTNELYTHPVTAASWAWAGLIVLIVAACWGAGGWCLSEDMQLVGGWLIVAGVCMAGVGAKAIHWL